MGKRAKSVLLDGPPKHGNQWRIYDKSMGLVAMYGIDEKEIRRALALAPDVIRGDLVLLKPGQPEPPRAPGHPPDSAPSGQPHE